MALHPRRYEEDDGGGGGAGISDELRRTNHEIKASPFYKKVFVLLASFCMVSLLMYIGIQHGFLFGEKPYGPDGLFILVIFGVYMVLTAFWLGHDIVNSLCNCWRRRSCC